MSNEKKSGIDFDKFEGRTKGGYEWAVVDAGRRVIEVAWEKTDVIVKVSDGGEAINSMYIDLYSAHILSAFDLIPKQEEWLAGWHPSHGCNYLTTAKDDVISSYMWVNCPIDRWNASTGNCYPDNEHGRKLAEARHKYEPLLAEIARCKDSEKIYSCLHQIITRLHEAPIVPRSMVVPHSLRELRPFGDYKDLIAAYRWFLSGYRLTIEDAEK